MKQFSLIAVLFTFTFNLTAQNLKNLDALQPPAAYDNIHVEKISSDERASCFVIWVKEEVKAHRHETHSESVIVLEGTAEMILGEETLQLKKGDYVYIPQGTVHAVKVTSKTPAKVFSVQAPEFLGKDRVFMEE